MNNFVVKKTISLQAEPWQVWEALTDPDKTRKYFFNCGVYSNWRENSPIIFRGRMLLIKKIEMKGTILKIAKEKMLKYVLRNSDGTSQSTVTDQLSYEDGKTILSITDDVGDGEGAKKRYERSMKGWDKVLKGLKKLLENSEQ